MQRNAKEEVIVKRKELGDPYIDSKIPHFELESGEVIYGKIGFPAGGERWWEGIKKVP